MCNSRPVKGKDEQQQETPGFWDKGASQVA